MLREEALTIMEMSSWEYSNGDMCHRETRYAFFSEDMIYVLTKSVFYEMHIASFRAEFHFLH